MPGAFAPGSRRGLEMHATFRGTLAGPAMSITDWNRVSMPFSDNQKILLERMDKAFGLFSQEAEKLSVLLAAKRDPSSWTSYHDLIRQKTVELVAYERYRKI